MNNDLISRSELKKDLKQYFTDGVLDGVSAKLAFNQILHDIDNAPTVTPKQGEWILMYCSCGDRYYTCSICNRAIEVKNGQSLKYYPFCHCGAEMRGEDNG